MLPTFKSFYNNVIKTLKESVSFNDLPTFDKPNTIYKHITVENGEKVIKGNVRFEHQQLTKLPDLSDVKVLGGFDCTFNRLVDLKGAPKHVGLRFACASNQLRTLEGAPKFVGGFFWSDNNLQLTNLKGAPEHVGGEFYCCRNNLLTLEGAPKYVGKSFYCNNNPKLISLKGLPKFIGGDLCWYDTKVSMEDFYENLLLSDVKGNPMAQDEDEGVLLGEYPEPPMSREDAYSTAKAYGLYNTPSEYTIDF
jgi:hypothetical protein